MKFDFSLEQKVKYTPNRDINGLNTTKILFIGRDEVLSEYAKDDTKFFMTLRELVFLYHAGSGYLTQLTDESMMDMYQEICNNSEIKGIGFYVTEKEILKEDNEFSSSHSNTIRYKYIK